MAEREAKEAIDKKTKERDEKVAQLKADFEQYRKDKLTEMNKKLSDSVTSLTKQITQMA